MNRPGILSAALSLVLLAAGGASANEVVSSETADGTAEAPETTDAEARPDRILDSPAALSPRLRSILNLPDSDVGAEAFGTGNHPYSTARVSAVGETTPVDREPWRITGKLFMRFGSDNFVCTASVIDLNLLVTAAHCVHNFGQEQDGFADAISFEPARHESDRPYGTWTGRTWYIPRVYFDGSDVCSPQAPGIVCENDVAVVVMEPDNEGRNLADVVGRYDVSEFDEFGYAHFIGQRAGHITQLGYPSRDFDGDKMIRSDSLGLWDDPFNVVWGSAQTGGSSGGPEIMNFGTETSATGPSATDEAPNVVVAVTSWGFTSGKVKVQGASRFSRNTTFTNDSNIRTLWRAACNDHADACDSSP